MDISHISKSWHPEYNITVEKTSNIDAIENNIGRHSQKGILIRDIAELRRDNPRSFNNIFGAEEENEQNIIVWMDPALEPCMFEAVYVHELLHRILRYEGFPKWNINTSHLKENQAHLGITAEELCGVVGSKIEHPEIYHRMRNQFQLDMSTYFTNQLPSLDSYLISEYDESPENIALNEQLGIIHAYEALYYDEHQSKIAIKMIEKRYPGITKYAIEAKRRVGETNSTPQGCSRSLSTIKELLRIFRTKKYGDRFESWCAPMWKCFDFKT